MFLGHSVMLSSVAELADLVTLVIKFKYQKKTPNIYTPVYQPSTRFHTIFCPVTCAPFAVAQFLNTG